MELYWKDWDWCQKLDNRDWAVGIEKRKTGAIPRPLSQPSELYLIQTEDDYQKLLKDIEAAEWFAFDTETSGLDFFSTTFRVAGLCFAFNAVQGWYLPMDHVSPDCGFSRGLLKHSKNQPQPFQLFNKDRVVKDLKALGFEDRGIVGHNLKYDLHVLHTIGIAHRGPCMDTMLTCQVEDPYRENGLKPRVAEFFGYEPEEMEWSGLSDGFCSTDPKKSFTYAAADPVNTLRLAYYLTERLDESIFNVCQVVEYPLIHKLVEIENFGVSLNTEQLQEFSVVLGPYIDQLDRDIRKLSGIDVNLSSYEERYNFLYRFLRVPCPNGIEPERQGATDDDALDGILVLANKLYELLRQERRVLVDYMDGRLGVLNVMNRIDELLIQCRTQRVPIPPGPITHAYCLDVLDTVDEVLHKLPGQMTMIRMIQSRAKLATLKNNFVCKLPDMRAEKDGLIHTEFRQILNSGRQAGKNPNLMQLPRDSEYEINLNGVLQKVNVDVRKTIVPPHGWKFVTADYDAMEMKMCAAVSGCPVLTAVVTGKDDEGKDLDAHIKTAELMGLLKGMSYAEAMRAKAQDGKKGGIKHPMHDFVVAERQRVKPIGFGLIYGTTEYGLSIQIGCSPAEALTLMDKYFGVFWGVRDWLHTTYEDAEQLGYADTALGRRRTIPEEAYTDSAKLHHYIRACGNHLIQGGCADMAKYCEIQVCDALANKRARFCNFIHDEMVIACPDVPEELCYAAAALEVGMQKNYLGVNFTATAEVKANMSKKTDNISGSIPGFGDPKYVEQVLQTLKKSRAEMLSLPW